MSRSDALHHLVHSFAEIDVLCVKLGLFGKAERHADHFLLRFEFRDKVCSYFF